MALQNLDVDTAESLAGVVRLLRRAAELVWERADLEGPWSPRQVLALGVDVVADDARNLLPDGFSVAGPVPNGVVPGELLQSAQRLLWHLCQSGGPIELDALRSLVAELVWEANTGV